MRNYIAKHGFLSKTPLLNGTAAIFPLFTQALAYWCSIWFTYCLWPDFVRRWDCYTSSSSLVTNSSLPRLSKRRPYPSRIPSISSRYLAKQSQRGILLIRKRVNETSTLRHGSAKKVFTLATTQIQSLFQSFLNLDITQFYNLHSPLTTSSRHIPLRIFLPPPNPPVIPIVAPMLSSAE